MTAEAPLFAGFDARELPTSRGVGARAGRGQRPAAVAAARLSAVAPDVARRRAAARRAPHRRRGRPGRLRRVVSPRAGGGPRPAQQAGDGPRPGRGDGRAGLRSLRRRGSRPGRARRLSDGARPSGAGCERAGGARHRPDRGGVAAGRPRLRAGLLALGVPRPARAAARAPHRRGPAGLLRPPRRRRAWAWVPSPAAIPRRSWTPTGGRFDDPDAVEAMCEDYRAGASVDAAHDDADRAAGRADRLPGPRAVGRRAAALPRFYDDVLDVWRPWAPDVRGEALDATHFLPEDRRRRPRTRCSPSWPGGSDDTPRTTPPSHGGRDSGHWHRHPRRAGEGIPQTGEAAQSRREQPLACEHCANHPEAAVSDPGPHSEPRPLQRRSTTKSRTSARRSPRCCVPTSPPWWWLARPAPSPARCATSWPTPR